MIYEPLISFSSLFIIVRLRWKKEKTQRLSLRIQFDDLLLVRTISLRVNTYDETKEKPMSLG
jgi:hypothetical protein